MMRLIMKERSEASLWLNLDADRISLFFPLLQQGVQIKTRLGCSIKNFLCSGLGIAPDYVEDRIRTVFLDGKAVDDLDSAIMKEGSTLSLSAAMPGLVGSTFKRGSHLAMFRSTVTHQKDVPDPASAGDGFVILKLFNLTVRELGPAILSGGIWLKPQVLQNFLKEQPDDFRTACKSVKKDGKAADQNQVPELKWPEETAFVLLTVNR
jgi:hypothetical protein